jgi:hypothetical protein
MFKLEKDSVENIIRITDVFLNNPKIYNWKKIYNIKYILYLNYMDQAPKDEIKTYANAMWVFIIFNIKRMT